MLMLIGRPPDNYDRSLDSRTAITGTLFFGPSGDQVETQTSRSG
jgi:hypothetical protein